MTIAITLALLTAAYLVVIAGASWLLWKLGVSSRRAVWLGFLLFGIVSGLLAALVWPLDSVILPNVYAVLAGDWLYWSAIGWLGDPRSNQAHDTVPWLLRVPQVYAVAASALFGVAGGAAQWAVNRMARRRGR